MSAESTTSPIPIQASTLPAPEGAATETTLAAIDTKLTSDSNYATVLLSGTNTLAIDCIGQASVMLQIGAGLNVALDGTIFFEGTVNESQGYFPISGSDLNAYDQQIPVSATSERPFSFFVGGLTKFRVRAELGTPVHVAMRTSKATGVINQVQAISDVAITGQPIQTTSA